MTRQFIFFLGFSCLLAVSCGNNDNECGDGLISIDQYIENNNLTTEETPEGVRYIVEEPGNAVRPALTDSVVVNYTGFLPDDNESIFDQSLSPRTFLLDNLIRGWEIGIPLVGEGGRIRLFIPSELGYGGRAVGSICPNSDLLFDIELVEVIPQ